MPSLRNTSGGDLLVGGRLVVADEVIQVDGKLAKAADQPPDAYLIGDGDDAQAWPHAHWTTTTSKEKD